MYIPAMPFEAWETLHRSELVARFRDYLRDVIDDAGFDLTQVEDYQAWAREEYACSEERATHYYQP